jgi:large subunit ribosomal protein L17
MRHGDKVNNLGRKSSHRKAMISNMACSLIRHKRINTTIAKAKALKVFVEPLLTKSKTDSTHSRRVVFSYLQDKEVVTELFREVAPKIATRNGGYTRIIKTGYRLGDNAEMCLIELVDFNEIYSNDSAKKTTRRSRRGGTKKTTDSVTETADNQEISDDVVVDVASAEVVEEVTDAVVVEETTQDVEEVGSDSTESSSEDDNDTTEESQSTEEEPKKD